MRTILILLTATLLVGCTGFEPLYGTRTGVARDLSGVQLVLPDSRLGQLVREELEDELAVSEATAPTYRVVVTLEERRFARGLRVDDTANRYELRLAVGYQVFDVATGAPVGSAGRPVYVTYESADQPYAGVIAGQDGQERAAAEAARILRTDLARFFAGINAARRAG